MNILNYKETDRIPVAHFGFWRDTLDIWKRGGYITDDEYLYEVNNSVDKSKLALKLGFDFTWYNLYKPRSSSVYPRFTPETLETLPNGHKKILDSNGVIKLVSDDITSIPAEIDHLLKDRVSFEEHFRHRLVFSKDRIDYAELERIKNDANRTDPLGLYCGSIFGYIRDIMGVVGSSYIQEDDPALFDELINAFGEISYKNTEAVLETGVKFDFALFWEDICYKNGPLINPKVFYVKAGPQYKRVCNLLNKHGINIVSVDCDGWIDLLLPTWIDNGVNTIFPLEVGTWNGNIAPWRELYKKEIRAVGGIDKNVFAKGYKEIDAEIERLKPLIALGGFIPGVDHQIAPDARFENVQYFCENIRKITSI
jgi:uroporphyrinogen decarboxylase